MKLTARLIETYKVPKGKGYVMLRDDGHPLAIRITEGGARTWLFLRRVGGTEKRHRLGSYGPIPIAEARRWASELAVAAMRGEDIAALLDPNRAAEKAMTVSDAWRRYIDLGCPKKNGKAKQPTTIQTDAYRWKHVEPHIGDIPIAALNDLDIRRMQRAVERAAGKDRRSSAGGAGTASHCVALVKALLSFAAREGLIEASAVGKAVPVRQSRQMERYLSPAELTRLFEALEGIATTSPRSRSAARAIMLLAATGMRKSEAFALTWPSIDFTNGTIKLIRDKAGNGRTVIINETAAAILERQVGADEKYVFPGRTAGKHLSNVQHTWTEALKAAKITEPTRLHDLRHSAASAWAAAGVPIFTVGALLGHRSIQTTRRYAHLGDTHLREASNKLKIVVGGKP